MHRVNRAFRRETTADVLGKNTIYFSNQWYLFSLAPSIILCTNTSNARLFQVVNKVTGFQRLDF